MKLAVHSEQYLLEWPQLMDLIWSQLEVTTVLVFCHTW